MTIDKMTRAQLRDTAAGMGFTFPGKMLRDDMLVRVHKYLAAAHTEALAENAKRSARPAAEDAAAVARNALRSHVEADHVAALAEAAVRDSQAAGSVNPAADPGWVAARDLAGQMTAAEADAHYAQAEAQRPLSADVATAAEVNHLTRLTSVTEKNDLGAEYTFWRHTQTDVRLDTEPDGTYAVRIPQRETPGYAIYADRLPTFVKARRLAGNAVADVRGQVDAAHALALPEHDRRRADEARAIVAEIPLTARHGMVGALCEAARDAISPTAALSAAGQARRLHEAAVERHAADVAPVALTPGLRLKFRPDAIAPKTIPYTEDVDQVWVYDGKSGIQEDPSGRAFTMVRSAYVHPEHGVTGVAVLAYVDDLLTAETWRAETRVTAAP